MKVKELIKYLEEADPEIEVDIWEYNHEYTTPGRHREPVISLVTRTSTTQSSKEVRITVEIN